MGKKKFIGILILLMTTQAQAWGQDCFDPTDERYTTFLSERASGISLYDIGKYMEAIPHFEKAHEMCPTDSVLNEYLYFSYKNTLRTMDANKLFNGVPANSVALYGLKRNKPISFIYAEGGALFADSKTAWDDSYIYFERYLVGNGGFASVDVGNEIGSKCELKHHMGLTSRTNPIEMKGSNSTYFNLKSKYVGIEYEVSAKFNISSRWKVMPYGRISHESYDEVCFALDTTAADTRSNYPFSTWNFPWDFNDSNSNRTEETENTVTGGEGNTSPGPLDSNPSSAGNDNKEANNGGNENGWPNGQEWSNGQEWQNGQEWPNGQNWYYNPTPNNNDNGQSNYQENPNPYNNHGYYNYVGWYNPWWSYLYNPYGQWNHNIPEYTPQFWQNLSNSTYKYTHTSTRHSRMDYLLGCLVTYTYGKHIGMLSSSFFKGETLKTIQANLSYYLYPFGNLNFYISPKIAYIWRGNNYYAIGKLPGNWLGEVEVGGKLLDRLWGSLSYLHGNLCDFHDRDSHTFYSLSCETKFRCSASLIYLLNSHCELMLTYKYMRKESNLFLVDVNGNADLNVFSQNDNVIAGGVQWNF